MVGQWVNSERGSIADQPRPGQGLKARKVIAQGGHGVMYTGVPALQAGERFDDIYPGLRSPTRSSLGYNLAGFQPLELERCRRASRQALDRVEGFRLTIGSRRAATGKTKIFYGEKLSPANRRQNKSVLANKHKAFIRFTAGFSGGQNGGFSGSQTNYNEKNELQDTRRAA